MDNYRLQCQRAKNYFLGYGQEALIRKLRLEHDEAYLYTRLLGIPYRIHRATGNIQRLEDTWVEADTHAEVMTLLDLICDSREDRYPSRRWANMLSFGAMFHRGLMEDGADAFARAIQGNREGFLRACRTLGGTPGPGGDLSFSLELFDGLCIAVQFWEGDEEFAPRVRFLWDENAPMYLKYETMWFALGLLKQRILALM